MRMMWKKWGIVLKALGICAILLVLRLVVDALNLDVITVNTVISAFVGGAIFTIAIIFSGTLIDYKESEKIPGELASAIRNLYHDSRVVQVEDQTLVRDLQKHTKALLHVINANFRSNAWRQKEITPAMDAVNDDICRLARANAPPQFIVKLRTEVSTIDRLSNRIEVIMETSFIPAAYAISELATAASIFVLLFIRLETFFEGIVVFLVFAAVLISLNLLIRDMDNPFEVGDDSHADVDMDLLWKLETYLDEKVPDDSLDRHQA
jgi:hypothetical protein